MTDIEMAKKHLENHSICFCKNGCIIVDDGRGLSPIMRLISENKDLTGYSVADIIVGKASAMLFVKAGITVVYGKTMSIGAREFLKQNGVTFFYDKITDYIINRDGIVCPMEKTVSEINNVDDAYNALLRKLTER